MARKLRVQYPGAIYHVMNRGDRREPIFKDGADRHRRVETLGECCEKSDWQVHAYCLMSRKGSVLNIDTIGFSSTHLPFCRCEDSIFDTCVHAPILPQHSPRVPRSSFRSSS